MPEILIAEPAEAVITKKAAVIDDAFDDVQENEIELSDFKEFFQEVENDLTPILERLEIANPEVSDWDESSPDYYTFLKKLWEQKADPGLQALLDHPKLFKDKLDKVKVLSSVVENLRSHDIDVQTFPSYLSVSQVFEQREYGYIFIDYNLGVKNGEAAITKAREVVKEIYSQYPENEKPLAILMSSMPNITELAKKFQQESGWLEGVFKSAAKNDLVNKGKVSLLAKTYEKAYSYSRTLQEYIQSLAAASSRAQKIFEQEVRMLSIEDYEYIQNSVLNEEKQPLGDYLAWLYGSRWTSLLYKDSELKKQQDIIDKTFSSNSPLLHSAMPSEKLADIFMTALFEDDLGKLKKHPLVGVAPAVEKLLYLHLGDLLSRPNSDEVFLVLNPQCDLERPSCSNKDNSIMLLPGKLQLLDANLKPQGIKTDFFIYNDRRYRIIWEMKQLKTIPHREMESWIKDKKLQRNFRLRLPYALYLQQQYSSNMSRVGLPVSPPLSNEITLTAYFAGAGATKVFLPENNKFAFFQIVKNNNDNKIRLTLDFALAFKTAAIEEVQNLTAWNNDPERTDKPKGLAKTIQKIDTFINEFDDWFLKHQGFNYPNINGGIEQVKKDIVMAAWDTVELDKLSTPFYILLKSNRTADLTQINATVEVNPKAAKAITAKVKISRRQKKIIKAAQPANARGRKGSKKK